MSLDQLLAKLTKGSSEVMSILAISLAKSIATVDIRSGDSSRGQKRDGPQKISEQPDGTIAAPIIPSRPVGGIVVTGERKRPPPSTSVISKGTLRAVVLKRLLLIFGDEYVHPMDLHTHLCDGVLHYLARYLEITVSSSQAESQVFKTHRFLETMVDGVEGDMQESSMIPSRILRQ